MRWLVGGNNTAETELRGVDGEGYFISWKNFANE